MKLWKIYISFGDEYDDLGFISVNSESITQAPFVKFFQFMVGSSDKLFRVWTS